MTGYVRGEWGAAVAAGGAYLGSALVWPWLGAQVGLLLGAVIVAIALVAWVAFMLLVDWRIERWLTRRERALRVLAGDHEP